MIEENKFAVKKSWNKPDLKILSKGYVDAKFVNARHEKTFVSSHFYAPSPGNPSPAFHEVVFQNGAPQVGLFTVSDFVS